MNSKSYVMKKILKIGCLAVLVIGTILVVSVLFSPETKEAFNEGYAKGQATVQPTTQVTFTLAQFNKISTGMSYEDVKAIMTIDGTVLSEGDFGDGLKVVVLQWMNEDGSNMNVTFNNGQVTMKAQAFLE